MRFIAALILALFSTTALADGCLTPAKNYSFTYNGFSDPARLTEVGVFTFDCKRGSCSMTGRGELAVLLPDGNSLIIQEEFESTNITVDDNCLWRVDFTATWDTGEVFDARSVTFVLSDGRKRLDAHITANGTSAVLTGTRR